MKTYAHHKTSASFQQALELGCTICVRPKPALQHEGSLDFTANSEEATSALPSTTYDSIGERYGERSDVNYFNDSDSRTAYLSMEHCSGQHKKPMHDGKLLNFDRRASTDRKSSHGNGYFCEHGR